MLNISSSAKTGDAPDATPGTTTAAVVLGQHDDILMAHASGPEDLSDENDYKQVQDSLCLPAGGGSVLLHC